MVGREVLFEEFTPALSPMLNRWSHGSVDKKSDAEAETVARVINEDTAIAWRFISCSVFSCGIVVK